MALTISPVTSTVGTTITSVPKSSDGFSQLIKSFAFEGIRSLHGEIGTIRSTLQSSKSVSFRELLLLQSRMGELGLRVELISKVAESALTTVKKFEQGA